MLSVCGIIGLKGNPHMANAELLGVRAKVYSDGQVKVMVTIYLPQKSVG
jgi:hypothetical protein